MKTISSKVKWLQVPNLHWNFNIPQMTIYDRLGCTLYRQAATRARCLLRFCFVSERRYFGSDKTKRQLYFSTWTVWKHSYSQLLKSFTSVGDPAPRLVSSLSQSMAKLLSTFWRFLEIRMTPTSNPGHRKGLRQKGRGRSPTRRLNAIMIVQHDFRKEKEEKQHLSRSRKVILRPWQHLHHFTRCWVSIRLGI